MTNAPNPSTQNNSGKHGYRVLARKYRPTTFQDMIGQETLVRTLSNAIESNRIAQAYVLTGVRGVGKTTTARIIAKALNHTSGPTVDLSQPCDHCDAIANDCHVDVVEMDAASHTGVDDIREMIDSVKYRPVHARYKIFILDEVHMLSKNAFNALLKTLEEPPNHVKFIFATTEIRKVPITILSRCQRFDLRRISTAELANHYQKICGLENVSIAPDAVTMIAQAADGSVRDGLSILDQAIALQTDGITADLVSDMLGLTNRGKIYELIKHLMAGDAIYSLTLVNDMHAIGARPLTICNDVLEALWFMTRCRVNPSLKDDPNTPEVERTTGAELASTLSMPSLSRAWQILLKGIDEIKSAPNELQALEMVFIRLMYASTLPTPDDIIKRLGSGQMSPPVTKGQQSITNTTPQNQQSGHQSTPKKIPNSNTEAVPTESVSRGDESLSQPPPQANVNSRSASPTPSPTAPVDQKSPIHLATFRDMVNHLSNNKEPLLVTHLTHDVSCSQYSMTESGGVIGLVTTNAVPDDFYNRLKRVLDNQTKVPWQINIIKEQVPTPKATLGQTLDAEKNASIDHAENDELVVALRSHFPKAKIDKVTPVAGGILDMNNANLSASPPNTK